MQALLVGWARLFVVAVSLPGCLSESARASTALTDPESLPAGAEAIVFAVRQPGKDPHYYANFGYFAFDPERKAYGQGGKLCRLNLTTSGLAVLLDDPKGGVRDPQVSYDGKKILFSYRRGETPNYLLYEIQAAGGGQLPRGAAIQHPAHERPGRDASPPYLDRSRAGCWSRMPRAEAVMRASGRTHAAAPNRGSQRHWNAVPLRRV